MYFLDKILKVILKIPSKFFFSSCHCNETKRKISDGGIFTDKIREYKYEANLRMPDIGSQKQTNNYRKENNFVIFFIQNKNLHRLKITFAFYV